ncbi:hypothetical protein MLD38_040641 [Melastoma candidum]|nr:hypothetical protein MLD38_040641 [Melastoma candidum]
MGSQASPASLRSALITGGASGIGECTARLFVTHGAKVVIADIHDNLGRSVCDSLEPENSTYVHCDTTNETDVVNAVVTAVSTYGKLDIMFHNAGIGGPNDVRIADNAKEDFELVLSINVTGVFLGTKHAARAMIPAPCGGQLHLHHACIESTSLLAELSPRSTISSNSTPLLLLLADQRR